MDCAGAEKARPCNFSPAIHLMVWNREKSQRNGIRGKKKCADAEAQFRSQVMQFLPSESFPGEWMFLTFFWDGIDGAWDEGEGVGVGIHVRKWEAIYR